MLMRPPRHVESISISGPQGSRRYAVSSDDGLIHGVADEDLVQLLAAGCEVASPIPPRPAPPKVRLRAPRPHTTFAPESGSTVRYTADADGYLDAAVEHVKALMRAESERVQGVPRSAECPEPIPIQTSGQ